MAVESLVVSFAITLHMLSQLCGRGAGAEVEKLKEEDPCRLVYVGDDGDVYEIGADHDPRRLTWGWADSFTADRLYYVWPAYSPDGSHVACFGVRSGHMPEAGLYAVADDGVRMHEIWRMQEAAPVCESWSPDSDHIALLLQGEDELALEIADIRNPGKTFTLERGAPLFWAWSPKDSYIAVHTGGSGSLYSDARLRVFRIEDDCEEVARLNPGEFRTPTWSPEGDRLAYVDASHDKQELLAFYRVDDGVGEIVCPVEGQTVMMWSPDGRTLALSQALGDSPHLYQGITLVDVATGRTTDLEIGEVASFFWSPCSKRLVTMAFDECSGMQWSVVDVGGDTQRLGKSFYPSRDLVYFCWFFDQFACSHPLISPDGSRLVFAGHMTEPSSERLDGQSQVYVASLEEERPVERVAAGHFACWDARVRESPT